MNNFKDFRTPRRKKWEVQTTYIKENIIKNYGNKKIWNLEIISKYINSSIEGYFLEEIFENKGADKDFENRAKIAIKEIAKFIDSALK